MRRLTTAELDRWRRIPAAVLSDERSHRGVLSGPRPLFAGRPFAAPALTIEVTPQAQGTPREALARAWAGVAIVIDASSASDAAVWGGNLIRIARERGVVAVVVDGNVRDTIELRDSGLAVCSRGVTPRGPMWTGHIDAPIECGGVAVRPGDLIVGDDDGVVAVPIGEVDDGLLARCRARIAREAKE
jgi:regulator of RNase E activity RraA